MPKSPQANQVDQGFSRPYLPDSPKAVQAWRQLAERARAENWSHEAYLTSVLARQVADKEAAALTKRTRRANFPTTKTLERFDLKRQPGLSSERLAELATGDYLGRNANVVLVGPPGTGKTHLAIGLGLKALRGGHDVVFASATRWINRLAAARDAHCLESELERLRNHQLLIIDELGYVPIRPDATSLLFQLVAGHYEHGSIIVTTHLPLDRWAEALGNATTAAAMVDRLAHHAEVITLSGDSYRTRTRDQSDTVRI